MFVYQQLFFLFALTGITSIITTSYLFQGFRNWVPCKKLKYMVNCPQCTGFWVGAFWGLFYNTIPTQFSYAVGVINALTWFFLWGGAVSLSSSFAVVLIDYITFAKSALLDQITLSASRDISNKEVTDDEGELE